MSARMRDGAAATAFASIAVSGQLPLWTLAAVSVSLVTALCGRRPLAKLGHVSGGALVVAGFALYAQVAWAGADLVVSACAFASLAVAQRVLSAPGPAVDGQVHLLNLLVVTGGAALSGELLFLLCLAAYALLSFLALAQAVPETYSPLTADERSGARGRALMGTALTLAGAVLFFVAFPRLSWNVAARHTHPWGRAEAGLSDRIRLQGGGTLKTSPRAVFRSRLDPDPGRELLEDAYWAVRTFSTFTGREWVGEPRPASPAVRIERSPPRPGDVLQETEVLPAFGSRALPLLETAVAVGDAYALTAQGSSRAALSAGEGGDESQDGEIRLVAPADAFRFRAWSRPGPSPAPEGTARNRDLPAGMDPRVAQLARRVANGAREPQATAEILATFLRKEYRYSLELADAPPDPVAHFLFESRTGHCEHFATALALMLRTLGLEARVATGFYGGSRTSDGRYVLRAGDAHAWTQVRVPGRGFITVDATPEAHRSASASRWSDWWAVQYERLTELWRQSVLDYSFRDQVRVASGLAHAPRLKSQVRVPRAELETVGTLGALLLATLGLFTLYRRRRRRADLHPATLAWLRVERSLGRQGFKRSATEPPREWVSRVSGAQPSLAHPLRSALRRYEETRFGGRTLQPHEAISWLRALRGR